ncbi:serine/threonine protein kinase [Isoptericola sp. NEAU-Y5]|uniref:non-specific serine/threonine protein kinase n=1 Tax=Isoptericola luteus TaxID=2879484 RepID=A0ABS7ZJ73_9MICO|nr:serine/threonine-protein kinase [Isoptericola sp. NEAU-Y5]MCA5895067.1 serine/threonine protein kinase [Isoptericola sp. NEAU-Y5]
MSRKRPPSPPPEIDGFEYVEIVGSGGFSDVFLYQQRRPRRRVAVKVLLHEWTGEGQREAFDAEADLMATLSTHPSIVTMYEADVAADGRPYLAMEFCSRPNMGARYRSERMSVPDVLRVAVQVAGAVETAHRAGILHRDIKPANILVTEYGHPALTDFGISSTLDDAGRAEGMSIPWSPPESFAEPPATGIGTDVWGLAATTYSLLASRTPFEVPGGSNTSADLVARIESAPLLPTGRSDVPASLERVLSTAMAKNPASRYPTALAFARALQAVQTELSFAVTPIDLLDNRGHVQDEDDGSLDGADDDEVGTRLREVVSVDPRGPASAGPAIASVPSGSGWAGQQVRPAPAPAPAGAPAVALEDDLGDTVHRSMAPAAPTAAVPAPAPEADAPQRRGLMIALGIMGAALLVAAVTLLVVLLPNTGDDPDDAATDVATSSGDDPAPPVDNLGGLVPAVTELEGKVEGDEVVFTWTNPDPQDGDTYGWRTPAALAEAHYQQLSEATVTVPRVEGGEGTCVEVVVVRSGAFSIQPKVQCVE